MQNLAIPKGYIEVMHGSLRVWLDWTAVGEDVVHAVDLQKGNQSLDKSLIFFLWSLSVLHVFLYFYIWLCVTEGELLKECFC